MNIEIDDVQRLILANQYEIIGLLRQFTAPDSDAEYYLKLSKSLSDGYPSIYERNIRNLIEENLSKTKSDFVVKILGIYGDIRDSYNELDESAKEEIEAWKVEFPGFDGNEEADYLAFANALLQNDQFNHTLSKKDLNSHHPTIYRYQEIIDMWQRLGEPKYPYSKKVILELTKL